MSAHGMRILGLATWRPGVLRLASRRFPTALSHSTATMGTVVHSGYVLTGGQPSAVESPWIERGSDGTLY
jgi:hypothetical protein